MSNPYLAELRVFSFGFAPKGWALCNGQLLAINQNQALFALLGTTYGGNGTTTFALPNLQGRVPMHSSASFVLGQPGGEAAHTLSIAEVPTHTHGVNASSAGATTTVLTGNVWATTTTGQYASGAATTSMASAAVATAGSSQPHENRPPLLGLNICIALAGIFPSRS